MASGLSGFQSLLDPARPYLPTHGLEGLSPMSLEGHMLIHLLPTVERGLTVCLVVFCGFSQFQLWVAATHIRPPDFFISSCGMVQLFWF